VEGHRQKLGTRRIRFLKGATTAFHPRDFDGSARTGSNGFGSYQLLVSDAIELLVVDDARGAIAETDVPTGNPIRLASRRRIG